MVLGLSILKDLGIRLKQKPSKLAIIFGLIKTSFTVKNKTQEEIEAQPEITDPNIAASLRVLADVSASAYWASPDLVPVVVFKMIQLTLKHGNSKKAPHAFAAAGYIFSAFTGKVQEGLRLGDISLSLAKKFKVTENMSQLLMIYNVFLAHWVKPFIETIHRP